MNIKQILSAPNFVLTICIVIMLTLSGCANSSKLKTDFAKEVIELDQDFLNGFVGALKDSNANNILKIEAFKDKPITINAKSFEVNIPIDLVAIFNSQAFRRDYGALFPKTTNGWDAYIATLESAERIASEPVPWLSTALRSVANRPSFEINGNANAVAGNDTSRADVIDSNNQTDSSDNSDNSTIAPAAVEADAPPEQ